MTWPHNAVPDGRYTELIAVATRAGPPIDHDVLTQMLMQSVAEDHWHTTGPGPLVEFADGPAAFLFAQAGTSHADRTLLAVGHPETPREVRDVVYQRGYPLPDTFAGRPVDRGHLIPYAGGGQYGPNLFVQDRALNRGWSRDGRGYRTLERAAVAGAPATLMFARPRYVDDTDVPGFIDLGVATATEIAVHTFRNRFDIDAERERAQLEIVLPGATNARIGALGEETASVLLKRTSVPPSSRWVMLDSHGTEPARTWTSSPVSAPSSSPMKSKPPTRQRKPADSPGLATFAAHRCSAPRTSGSGQASQPYVADRLRAHLDVGDGYDGIVVQVIAVDFVAMLAQWFHVNDAGTGLRPSGPPIDCADAAQQALNQIVDHRGRL